MKGILPVIKNKFFISFAFVMLYVLLMHDTDVFALMNKNERVNELSTLIEQKESEIESLRIAINDLNDPRTLEKYAREHHYFKKEDEDLFIFSFE